MCAVYSVNQKGQGRKRILPKTERHRKGSEKFMASENIALPHVIKFASENPFLWTGMKDASAESRK